MSAPLVWIVLPMVAGLVFWVMRKQAGLVILLSTFLCLLLALLAWALPVGTPIQVGPVTIQINPTLAFAGRRLVLQSSDLPLMVFVYLLCAFWFAGSQAAGADRLLVPFGLGFVSLLVAAQAVEPFLYAALLIEMAVLLAVPLLAPPGRQFGQGVLRFLIFQTLAMPFILLAGWAMAGVQADPSNETLRLLSTLFVGFGFAFWLAIFPFYSWIPLLSEQSHPYVTGFLFLVLLSINLLLGLGFLDQFGWLRELPGLFPALRQVGVLMVVTAGVWAAFQRDLARLMGYGVIVETGFSLLAISLSSRIGLELFASMFIPRVIGMGLWALSLAVILRQTGSGKFDAVQGIARKLPFASAGLAVASLSLAGLPLLAVYPIRQVLLEGIAGQQLTSALWALIGMIGMLFSTFRALFVLSRHQPEEENDPAPEAATALPEASAVEGQAAGSPAPSAAVAVPPAPGKPRQPAYCETPVQIILLISGISLLIIIGIFPQAFFPLTRGLLDGFATLP